MAGFIAILDSGINIANPLFINSDGTSRIFAIWDQTASGTDDSISYRAVSGIDASISYRAVSGTDASISYRAVSGIDNSDRAASDVDNSLSISEGFGVKDINETSKNKMPEVSFGRLYGSDEINYYLKNGTAFPVSDLKGHGSAVAAIALKVFLDNSNNSNVCNLIIVKLSNSNLSKTSSIMYAVDFCIRLAESMNSYLAINLSYGSNEGAHDGMNLLEMYLDELCKGHKINIIVATGNEGAAGHHARLLPDDFSPLSSTTSEAFAENTEGIRTPARQHDSADLKIFVDNNTTYFTGEVNFQVSFAEKALYLSVYRDFYDEVVFELIAPSGESAILEAGFDLIVLDACRISYIESSGSPFSKNDELKIIWLPNPEHQNVPDGLWSIRVFSAGAPPVSPIDLWLPTSEGLVGDTVFLKPDTDISLTIPSTAEGVISVGAYDSSLLQSAIFSGCGFTRDYRIKPDVAAPGISINAPGGPYTGTSFSAPFVTGLCAAMYDVSDPYLYGNRMKKRLIKMACPLSNKSIPSKKTGWGVVETAGPMS